MAYLDAAGDVVSLATRVGDSELRSFVLTAAGTAGYGDELAGYGDLSELGALVTKSLAHFAHEGNRAPRVVAEGVDMLNSVGLAGPGIPAWLDDELPAARARGATVVASLWGRTVEDYARGAELLADADILALEINASCPNLEGRSRMFAHSAEMTADLVRASAPVERPRWVKLSPNTPDLVEIAGAALDAGADALVLVNTVLGLSIDVESRRPALGGVGGGLSGPGILPVALRAVYDVHAAFPDAPLVGVGGVSSGRDALALVMAGASAVEVGTASFADPRAPWRIQREATEWLARHGVSRVGELVGVAHG
jgi:dihydroorotate dehydrogenase (NAD+) catalytic subunit